MALLAWPRRGSEPQSVRRQPFQTQWRASQPHYRTTTLCWTLGSQFRGPRSKELKIGAYYTILTGIGLTNLATTITHSLSITPASLVVRPIIHQALVTNTAPVLVNTVGTNIATVASGVGTLVTCDIEIQLIHSIIQ